MKENRKKGFSMMELIVVIAIIGLFTALATIGFGYLKAGNVKSTAKTIDSTLNKLKLDTMSKEEKPYMYLWQSGNDYYMYCTTGAFSKDSDTVKKNAQRIGNANVKITVDGSVLGSSPKTIAFKKGSGAFADSSDIKSTIKVEEKDGTGTSYVINLVKDTGKHYIKINGK